MKHSLEAPRSSSARRAWLAVCTFALCAPLFAGCGSVESEEPLAPPVIELTADEALHPERRGIGAELVPTQEGPSALAITIDSRRSLAVTDEAILSQFSFQAVMDQLVAQAGGGITRLQLFQQWWDTARAAPSLNLGPHCNDPGIANMNGFPYTCPRAEGNQATLDPFFNAPISPDAYLPIALFNRFDLAPTNGANCGEYRIIFARRSGISNPFIRNLIIFEAVLPNPQPSKGLEGCRPVASFWANLTSNTDVNSRATALRGFYFTGLSGFMPVIHIDNLGNRTSNTGQVRTNQFMQSNWLLREFKVKKACPTCPLQFIPVTVKTNPGGSLFKQGSAHTLAPEFQSTAFPNQVPSLAVNDINRFNMSVADKFNSGQSDSQSSTENHYVNQFVGATTFRSNIQVKIPTSGLTPDHIVARAQALSCAGCHQLSNNADLGGGITWPASLGFVHVTERQLEPSPSGGNRFVISPALTSTFLPHRKAVLEGFVNAACGDGVCQAWEGSIANSCGSDCGCAPTWQTCCGTCIAPTDQCLDVQCPQ